MIRKYRPLKERVTSNRKTTKGRKIYYQQIYDENGKLINTIKHRQT